MDAGLTMLSFLTEILTEKQIIERVKKEIAEYEEAILLNKPEEEIKTRFSYFALSCIMVLMKKLGKSTLEIEKEIDLIIARRKLIDPEKS